MNSQGGNMAVPKDEGERYTDKAYIKVCFQCGKNYFPKVGAYKRTKYCGKTCYYGAQSNRLRERGIYKGGYNRETHIVLWLWARGEEYLSAPCHYCGTSLAPNKFVIDHKIPRSLCKTRKEMTNKYNLVVSCYSCNELKASTDYETFKARLETNKIMGEDQNG